jgi:hypothetical protein
MGCGFSWGRTVVRGGGATWTCREQHSIFLYGLTADRVEENTPGTGCDNVAEPPGDPFLGAWACCDR